MDAAAAHRVPTSAIGLSLASWTLFATSGPVAGAVMVAGWSPAAVTTVRISLAAMLVGPFVTSLRPEALKFRRADIWPILGYGSLGVAGVQLCFFLAVSRVPVGVAIVLANLAPVLVAGWTRLVRGTRLPGRVWLGIALALIGLAGVVEIWTESGLDLVGVVAGMASAGCSAGYFLLGQHGARHHDPWGLAAAGLVIGAVLVCVAAPPWTLPFGTLTRSATLGGSDVPIWLALVGLAAASTALPYVAGIHALRELPVTLASVLAVVEPLIASALAWLLLNQSLGWPQLAGGVLLVGGAVLVQLSMAQTVVVESLPTD